MEDNDPVDQPQPGDPGNRPGNPMAPANVGRSPQQMLQQMQMRQQQMQEQQGQPPALQPPSE